MYISKEAHFRQPVIRLNNEPIPIIESVKFLGFTFDNKYKWDKHIENHWDLTVAHL